MRAHSAILLAAFLALPTPVCWGQTLLVPPELLGEVTTPSDAFEVVPMDDIALVTNYSAGLLVIDVSDPSGPWIAATHDTPGLAIQCALAGSRGFIADHEGGGLQIVNLSAPTAPSHAGQFVTGDVALMAAWHDGVVLVGYNEARVDVVDVSNPSQPSLLSSFPTTGAPRHAVFGGTYAFIADYGFGLIVVDMSDPSSPQQVGGLTASRPLGADLAGTTLYLACSNGLRTIDVSNPAAPLSLDRVQLPGPAVKVEQAGGFAFVAAHVAGGLQVVDVGAPQDLSVATSYVTGRYTHGVAISGQHAYLADGNTMKVFRVFDSSVSTSPTSFGNLKARYRGR